MVAIQIDAFYNHLQYHIKKVKSWILIMTMETKKIEGFLTPKK